MTKSEQRVAVAKDALKQLKDERYMASKGSYTGALQTYLGQWNDDDQLENGKAQAQPLLKKIGLCRVCAKGALFLSSIRKFNKATVADIVVDNLEVAEKIFGENNFDRIESAFEGWEVLKGDGNFGDPAPKEYAFGQQYTNDHDRLVAILKNIIKNNGLFKP